MSGGRQCVIAIKKGPKPLAMHLVQSLNQLALWPGISWLFLCLETGKKADEALRLSIEQWPIRH
jgi:hypothetical protein